MKAAQSRSQPATKQSAVLNAARIFREDILAREVGAYLGTEEELMLRANVSRHTFRQSARILEEEKLLEIRRGNGGGFFASRPSIEDAVRVAVNAMRASEVSVGGCEAIVRALEPEVLCAAARCTDPVLRQRLISHIESYIFLPSAQRTIGDILKAEAELAALVTEMAGGQLLGMLMAMMRELGVGYDERVFVGDVDGAREWDRLRGRLAEALHAGDEFLVRAFADARIALADASLRRLHVPQM